jgi:shikimate dehydrogenase
MRNVVLIGMPGSGKTSLGRRAAEELNMAFLDVDAAIEEEEGRKVSEIFAQNGEAYFRGKESAVIEGLARSSGLDGTPGAAANGLIVSVGGGAVERDNNVRAMRRLGFVIFIDRPLSAIRSDIRYGADRPLLSDSAKLEELYAGRIDRYREASHRILKNEGDYSGVLDRLTAMICLLGVGMEYCVIGDPIAHSLSPLLHRTAFEYAGSEYRYGAARVRRGEVPEALEDIRTGNLKGLNVTAPHKFAFAGYLDGLEGDAARSGAVNTIVKRGGNLIGFNTDMKGLLLALNREGGSYAGRKIAVLGTGGAAAGIVHRAASEGAPRIALIGRNGRKAEEIAAAVHAGLCAEGAGEDGAPALPIVLYDFETGRGGDLSAVLSDTEVLINATPLGMEGVPSQFAHFDFLKGLPKGALVYDLIYRPAETALLAAARALGLRAANGLGMLAGQGILADEIFLDRAIDREALFDLIFKKLSGMMEYAETRPENQSGNYEKRVAAE